MYGLALLSVVFSIFNQFVAFLEILGFGGLGGTWGALKPSSKVGGLKIRKNKNNPGEPKRVA